MQPLWIVYVDMAARAMKTGQNKKEHPSRSLSCCLLNLAVRSDEKEGVTLLFLMAFHFHLDAKIIKIFEIDAPIVSFIFKYKDFTHNPAVKAKDAQPEDRAPRVKKKNKEKV